MNTPRIGSLFSGYGGLDLAVEQVFGARTAWHCEIEPAPSKVLAAHWPGVPNHRDITAVRWADVEPVDILTGGFPCPILLCLPREPKHVTDQWVAVTAAGMAPRPPRKA